MPARKRGRKPASTPEQRRELLAIAFEIQHAHEIRTQYSHIPILEEVDLTETPPIDDQPKLTSRAIAIYLSKPSCPEVLPEPFRELSAKRLEAIILQAEKEFRRKLIEEQVFQPGGLLETLSLYSVGRVGLSKQRKNY